MSSFDKLRKICLDLGFMTLIVRSSCYVNYEMFNGFAPDFFTALFSNADHTKAPFSNRVWATSTVKSDDDKNIGTVLKIMTHKINEMHSQKNTTSSQSSLYNITHESLNNIKKFSEKCPETERPQNIGTYEIPTKRDLVLFTKRTLVKLANNYHKKMLFLLKDIKEASRSTIEVEKKCFGRGKILYKQCVKDVSRRCIAITKDLVASLERQEAEVSALTEDRVCDMTDMKTDPIELIKLLAMDEATTDFALPAFLRLLGACSVHCHKPSEPDRRPRLRQMTDQDLVVRHFLTNKNYVQLIKDTNTYRAQNINTQRGNSLSGYKYAPL